ncbi:hypothetical protein CRUP_005700 [Coryphaenoides rupestris]|nr:hypothetical protein CRUP_005700 [Coryphaenoides rupestris]
MNGSQRPGGDTFIVEADVIFHTVNSDLASFAGVDKKTCPGLLVKDNNAPLIGQFLQCNQPVNSNAPATLEREYLLDGKKMSLRDQTGDSLCVTKDHQFQMSNHKAGLEITDAINRNGLSGKMGNGISGSFGHPDSGQGAESTLGTKEPDLVIEVGGQKINAHKSILAAKSDYFKARLSRDILKVKGLSYKTLSVLIDYIYTSQINVSKDNVVDVITGAKILQVPCAVQAAMDSMSQQITAENCYEILCIAKKQRLQELKETAYCFMSDNFLQVLRDPSVYGRLTGSERDLILRKRTEGRQTLMVAEVHDVFDRAGSRPPSRCGSRPQSPLSVVSFDENHMMYYFDETTNDWRSLTAIPEDINTKGCGMCTMYNYLFVAGGIKGSGEKGKVSDRVFYYNPVNNRWTEVRPMNQARAQLKLVSMDGHLYAIGGECLFTGAFAVAHEATTCSGELYVSGARSLPPAQVYSKRDRVQMPYTAAERGINVFKYNTIVKMWHDCASQRLGSASPFRCAVMGNCIYCVNRSQTLRFVVERKTPYFVEELPPSATGGQRQKSDTVA